jgi:hypothetical protein
MQSVLTSGAQHGRTPRLDVWDLARRKRKRRPRRALGASHPPISPAQACTAVGRPLRGHRVAWAAGGPKDRWPLWLTLGCCVSCPLDRVEAGATPQRGRNGSVRVGECRSSGGLGSLGLGRGDEGKAVRLQGHRH